jgi:hypothetical protein
MEFEANFFVLFPDIAVLEMIIEIAANQVVLISLNLALFLTNQMVCRRLMIAAMIVTLL